MDASPINWNEIFTTLIGAIATGFALWIGLQMARVAAQAKQNSEDSVELKKISMDSAEVLTKVHTEVNNKAILMASKIDKLTEEVLRLSKVNATMEEEKRGNQIAGIKAAAIAKSKS